jgi:murein DD-endopeptidase MepM/ murein hydrolase activator NlpD
MMKEEFRLREKTLSGKVDAAMEKAWEAIKSMLVKQFTALGRELAKRFANRKTAAAASISLFSLLFLLGSTPVVRAKAASAQGGSAASSLVQNGAKAAPGRGGAVTAAQAAESIGLVAEGKSSEGLDRGLYFTAYKVARGDTLSDIADNFDVSLDTVVSFNGIKNARSLQPGTLLKIPSMSGILYTAKAGDSASSVAAANGISADRVIEANGLMSDSLESGRRVFLPDAKLASFTLREISGDLFMWPARAWISDWYGWRKDPFSGARSFHTGIDIGVDTGTPVRAAMEGRVSETGYNSSFGNYILINHHAGWMTLYGHLQSISVKEGQRVDSGQRIAYSGNTGYSTGPHLHFSVYKNGRTVNPYNVLH